MKQLAKILPGTTQSFCSQLQRGSVEHELSKTGSSEISVFIDNKASDGQISSAVKKLSVAFPDMEPIFFNLLVERIAKSGFTAQRLDYVINKLLDTCHYKRFTIADVMSFDVRCKIYSYREMQDEVWATKGSSDHYSPIWFSSAKNPHWVLKADKERYNLPERL